jgi:hypothetical protein
MRLENSQYAPGAQRKSGQLAPTIGYSTQTELRHSMRGPHDEEPEHVEPGAGSLTQVLLMHTKGVVQVPSARHDSPRLPPAVHRLAQAAPLQRSIVSVQSAALKQVAFAIAAGAVMPLQSVELPGVLLPEQDAPLMDARHAWPWAALKVAAPASTERSVASMLEPTPAPFANNCLTTMAHSACAPAGS